MNQDYNPTELLAYVAAGLLEDNKSVFVGTGLPMIGASGLSHHAGLPERAWRSRTSWTANEQRPLPGHHPTGRIRL